MTLRSLTLFCLAATALSAWGQNDAAAKVPEAGSPSFCLYEVPTDDGGRRRWVNLGIVQYVEATPGDVRLVFGGGNLGSGHEVKIPMASKEQGLAFVDTLRKAAGECRRGQG